MMDHEEIVVTDNSEKTLVCPGCGRSFTLAETSWLDIEQVYVYECSQCGQIVTIG